MNTFKLNKFLCRGHFLYLLLLSFYVNAQTTPAGFNLVAYEGFNYSSGSSLLNASGGTGWSTNWIKTYDNRYLKTATSGFAYTGLATTGLKAEFDGTCYGTCTTDISALKRSFSLQNEGVVYFQFISVFESSAGGGTPTIRFFNGGAQTGGVGSSSGSNMSILDASLANLSSTSSSLSAQNFVLVRIDYNLNKTDMWINPNLETFDYSNPTGPSATATSFAPAFDRIDIFLRSGSIDEITILKQIPTLNKYGKKDTNISQSVNNNGSLGYGNGLTPEGKIISFGTNGLTAGAASTSAYQIKQDYPSATDGLYWIKNPNINGGTPFQIYADMTTDGGGWTLILCNNNISGWNASNAVLRNETAPTINGQYSIIAYADYIKKSTSGFQYMMDATSRGRWGGIWTANQAYSFVNTNNTQRDITLNTKFDSWTYQGSGIEEIMPWYSPGACGTITTSNDANGDWWGTLVSTCSFNPAPWLGCCGNSDPGIIWYWVR